MASSPELIEGVEEASAAKGKGKEEQEEGAAGEDIIAHQGGSDIEFEHEASSCSKEVEDRSAIGNFAWEPRISASVAKETKFAKQARRPAQLTNATWSYPWAWFEALLWYWKQIKFGDDTTMREEHRTAGSLFTPWLYLAIDFRFATGLALARQGGSEKDMAWMSMARLFGAASRQMSKLCGSTFNFEYTANAVTLMPLGAGRTQGIGGIAVLLQPEVVNRALYKMAVAMREGTLKKGTLNIMCEFPSLGPLLWANNTTSHYIDRPKGMHGQALREKTKLATPTVASAAANRRKHTNAVKPKQAARRKQ